jgi:hypothetical protein
MHKNGCFFNNLIYFLPSHPKSPNLLNLKGIVQKRWINPDLLSKNLKLCIETTSSILVEGFTFLSIRSPWRGRGVLEFHISIHTKPLAGQRRFGVSHFYPYEAPGGAEAFWSFTFLSIRSPWRGRGVLEFHISIHTKPLAGQRRFGVSHFYPYEAPGGAEAFWSFTFLSIRSPWRGRGVLEFHISIHTKPLAGQRRFGVSHFYPYEEAVSKVGFGFQNLSNYDAE